MKRKGLLMPSVFSFFGTPSKLDISQVSVLLEVLLVHHLNT